MTNQRAIKVINVFLGTDDLCSCSEDRLHISCKDCRREAARMAIEALKEQKTGKWKLCTDEKYDVDYYVCSNCGYEPYRKMEISNYCPNCGCKMRCK